MASTRPRFRSAAQLMRGMAIAVVVAAVFVAGVGVWAALRSAALERDTAALNAAALAISRAQTDVASGSRHTGSDLAVAVADAGLPAESVAAARAVDELLAVPGTPVTASRTMATRSLTDLATRVDEALAAVDATAAAWRLQRMAVLLLAVAIAASVVLGASLWVRNSLFARFKDMSMTAARINAGAPDRLDTSVHDPLGGVAHAFNTGVDLQQGLIERLEQEVGRSELSRQIADALDMAPDEPGAVEALAVALPRIHQVGPVELLLSRDGHRAELAHAVTDDGGPLCPVTSVADCVALRRGATQVFPDPDAINACPRLRERDRRTTSAVCLPVTFLGSPLGVVHATTTDESAPRLTAAPGLLAELSSLAGGRLGTIRAFAHEQHQARTDTLTGLPNRRSFTEEATRQLRRGGVLAMGDLDHFKMVNDTYGHDVGDTALCLFADVLRSVTRQEDPLARWGGEEFAMLLPAATMSDAIDVVTRLRDRLAAACAITPPAFTTSWGLTLVDGGSLDALVQRADMALYQAKERGRNRWVIADSDSAADEIDLDEEMAAEPTRG